MAALLRLSLAAAVAAFLSACGDTLVFQERTKAGIDISFKDDPVEPAELLAGYKRTVVALVPPKDGAACTAADKDQCAGFKGEALSLISRFEQGRTIEKPQAGQSGGDVVAYLHSAFATGKAAATIGAKPAAAGALLYANEPLGITSQSLRQAVQPYAACVRRLRAANQTAGLMKALGQESTGADGDAEVLLTRLGSLRSLTELQQLAPKLDPLCKGS